MFERGQQKRAKLAPLAVGELQEFFLEETGKKGLRQVLRILRTTALATNISVKRIPVTAAKFLQGILRAGRGIMARSEHDAPVCCRKVAAVGSGGAPGGVRCGHGLHRGQRAWLWQ